MQSPNTNLIGVPGGARRLVTPALIIDLPALRANLADMNERCTAAGLALRPHGKTHKCSVIAREQLNAGAVGICAASGKEALAFAGADLSGILVTTPIVQPWHVDALCALHRADADISVVFDSIDGIAVWERALENCHRTLPAFVDLDIGMGRTGVASSRDAVSIARRLTESPAFYYAGLQAYSGRVQHILDYAERRATYGRQLERLEAALTALRAAGLTPPVVSGGGTGTFATDVERKIYSESQAGSYCLMDVDYDLVQLFPDEANPFRFSLHLRTSVVSANQPGFVSINAGFKSLSTDGPTPRVRPGQHPGADYAFFGDEFGMLTLPDAAARPRVGDIVDLEVSHCDPTVNLHDFYHVLDGDTVVDIWRIDARGTL